MGGIQFDAGRCFPLISRLGTAALGVLAWAVAYKVYTVFHARLSSHDDLSSIYEGGHYRSTVDFPCSRITQLAGHLIVCVDGSTVGKFEIDPNPYLLGAKVHKVASSVLPGTPGSPYLMSARGKQPIWFDQAEKKLYRGDRSWPLPEDVVALSEDVHQTITTVTKEGKIQEWKFSALGLEADGEFNGLAVQGDVRLIRKFIQSGQPYLFIAYGDGSAELYDGKKTKKRLSEKGDEITAFTPLPDVLLIARGTQLQIVDKNLPIGFGHPVQDISYDAGRLFALGGGKLTVLDFNRPSEPGWTARLWDWMLRLFT